MCQSDVIITNFLSVTAGLSPLTPLVAAQECVELPDLQCNGFDFCVEGVQSTCFITEVQYSGNGVHVSDASSCSHYERECT